MAGTPNALVVHPLDPDRLLAATPATLLASDDGGATWRRVPGVQPAAVAQPVVAAPERVVVIDERQIDRQRVLVSDDFGATWRTGATLGDTAVGLLLPAPSDPLRLYALTGTSLLTSADGGASWSAHGQPLDGRGPVVRLAAAEARLVPIAGGREPPGFRLPLTLDAAERGGAFTDARLVVRRGGRARTIGIGSVRFGARHAANLRIELRRGADGMVRNAGHAAGAAASRVDRRRRRRRHPLGAADPGRRQPAGVAGRAVPAAPSGRRTRSRAAAPGPAAGSWAGPAPAAWC